MDEWDNNENNMDQYGLIWINWMNNRIIGMTGLIYGLMGSSWAKHVG